MQIQVSFCVDKEKIRKHWTLGVCISIFTYAKSLSEEMKTLENWKLTNDLLGDEHVNILLVSNSISWKTWQFNKIVSFKPNENSKLSHSFDKF